MRRRRVVHAGIARCYGRPKGRVSVQSVTVRFAILGALRVWRGSTELDIGPPQQRAVLALLLARGGQPVSQTELVDLLWSADPPASAVNIVHRYIGALRRVLEPELPPRAVGRWLVRHGGGYRAAIDAESLDLLRFRALARQAREAAASGQAGEAVPFYVAALGLCHGPCAGDPAVVRGHPAFTAVDQECLGVAREAADAALAAGLAEPLLPALRQAAERDRLAEPVQARLMLALAASGNQAEALAVYERTRACLAEDLGLEPGTELRQAHSRVLRQQAAEPGYAGHAVAPSAAQPVVRPAQLPADLAAFAGRRPEVARVLQMLAAHPRASPTTPIVMIDGMPGAGKTALAVHCGHALAERFPDGQLYVNLRGFGPGEAVSPTEALRGFLKAFGVPAQRIPADRGGQAAAYRSLLAGKRVLVILDNARDDAHVQPLLPGAAGCAVIATSRNCLSGLVASDGAQALTLDVFPPGDARAALAVRLGADRVAAEPDAVEEIVALSGRLPLALALVAARAAARPRFPLAVIAAELRQAKGSLDAFSDTGLPDVRAVFFWSYRLLRPSAGRLFRLISLHPGPDISLPAAASLADVPALEARALLSELAWARLLSENHRGRFSFHDLLRSYAAELCAQTDTPAARDAAVSRFLSHYLHSAHNSHIHFRPHQQTPEPDPPDPGVRPEEAGDYAAALEWFTAEHRVLEAVVSYAGSRGFTAHAWHLAYKLTLFYQRKGFWHDWAATARAALGAARDGGDQGGQAHMHRMLAGALLHLGHSAAALAELERTRELYTELGYTTEHAYLQSNFGAVLARLGRYDDAIAHHRQALDLYRAAGLRIGEALAMEGIGSCANRLGDYHQAVASITEALRIHRELDDTSGTANSLASLGQSYYLVGDYAQAAEFTEQALRLYRAMGSGADEAEVLMALGDIRLAAGEQAEAGACLAGALAILDALRLPQADELRARLAEIDGPTASTAER
jgi:DNA-binding SARP family transcriptional activator/tetratricopeptide (TPR) repeat protein